MKFSFTKSKAKYVLASLLIVFTIASFFLSGFFVYSLRKLIVFSIALPIVAVILFLLLFHIETTDKTDKLLKFICFLIFPIISLYIVEFLQRSFQRLSLKGFISNYLIYLALFLLVSFISTRVKLSFYISTPIVLVIGLINHYVMAFRGSPMQPWDIAAAKTAMNVVDNFIFTVDETVVWAILLLALQLTLTHLLKNDTIYHKKNLPFLIIMAAVLLTSVISPTCMIYKNKWHFFRDPWNQTDCSKINGYATNFLLNVQLLSIKEPENYSIEQVNNILKNYTTDTTSEHQPNIIIIMNEAFSDLSYMKNDLGLDKDYMPFVHSLMGAENTVSGKLHVSIYGGGTCNTEYEALTSNVCTMLRAGSYPMQQFITSDSTSLASNLKQLGYKTVGIHPYFGSGWNRARAYPFLGFDEFITIDDFDDSAEKVRDYISDAACYQKIEHISEETTDQPLFLFAVTMQNHGGYTTEWTDMPDTINFANENDYQQFKQYVELASMSDTAFKDLIEYYSKDKRETIVLFFGDHQPNLGDEYEKLFPKTTSGKLKEIMPKFTVPFVIWSNYDIKEQSELEISPCYLAPLLLKSAGAKQTSYYKFLNDLRNDINVITGVTCSDTNGNTFDVNDAENKYTELLKQYSVLQYNNVFDRANLVKDKFTYSAN